MKRILTKEEIKQGYYDDENQLFVCARCKEWACMSYDSETHEELGSNCCGRGELQYDEDDEREFEIKTAKGIT